jgi:hypothetical protein
MCRCDVEIELFHEPGQPRRLTLRQVQDQPGEGRGVDDRVHERALEAATDEPGVEGVVAVLHQDSPLSKAEKCSPRVSELGCSDEHRALDVVTPSSVWIDGGPAVDKRVEEGQRPRQREPLGTDLQDQERCVARRLHVQGHELRVLESRARPDLGRVDGDLLPGHRLDRAARFEENRFLCPAKFGLSRGPLSRRHLPTNASAPGPAPSGRTRSRPR